MLNVAGFGNLVRPVEVKTFDGNNLCSFSIASSTRVKKGKEYVYEPTYLDVDYWCKSTDYMESLEKGDKVYVVGELVQEHWEKDGQKRSKIVCKATSVQGLASKKEQASKTDGVKPTSNDDVPF